ncbi:hypothetical protein [Bacillus dakarensis]|uniref:hypothetical protein n=1 Tax=Robertmurraya dakarensis TaxID=1926278 RepID=UPI00098199BE|nr:hypothetical protein [Bacillus dakarensis]
MKLFTENGYYEVVYENKSYEFLEFIRIDTICDKSYVTLKNVVTGEMFTFDQENIHKVRKRLFHFPSKRKRKENKVASYIDYSI